MDSALSVEWLRTIFSEFAYSSIMYEGLDAPVDDLLGQLLHYALWRSQSETSKTPQVALTADALSQLLDARFTPDEPLRPGERAEQLEAAILAWLGTEEDRPCVKVPPTLRDSEEWQKLFKWLNELWPSPGAAHPSDPVLAAIRCRQSLWADRRRPSPAAREATVAEVKKIIRDAILERIDQQEQNLDAAFRQHSELHAFQSDVWVYTLPRRRLPISSGRRRSRSRKAMRRTRWRSCARPRRRCAARSNRAPRRTSAAPWTGCARR